MELCNQHGVNMPQNVRRRGESWRKSQLRLNKVKLVKNWNSKTEAKLWQDYQIGNAVHKNAAEYLLN